MLFLQSFSPFLVCFSGRAAAGVNFIGCNLIALAFPILCLGNIVKLVSIKNRNLVCGVTVGRIKLVRFFVCLNSFFEFSIVSIIVRLVVIETYILFGRIRRS